MTNSQRRFDEPLRIGAVAYLNATPLIYGLERLMPNAVVACDHPSRLADDLAAGRLDVALAPSVEFARRPEWITVSDACIGSRGPVLSVKLLLRRPPEKVRSLAVDDGSRTSAVLAQMLLADLHGVRPRVQSLPVDASPSEATADAVLVIGDRAIRSPDDAYVDAWDLGERWRQWTGLPFVFAAWAARPGVDVSAVGPALAAARDEGLLAIEAIAAERAAAMRLPYELVLTYLRDHLHFRLGPDEQRGLNRFLTRASALGLIAPRRISPPSGAAAEGRPKAELPAALR